MKAQQWKPQAEKSTEAALEMVSQETYTSSSTVIRQPKRRILPTGLGWVLIAFRLMVVADGEFMTPKAFLAKAAFGFGSQLLRWPGAADVMAGRNHLLTGNLWRRTGGSKRQIAGFVGGAHPESAPEARAFPSKL